MGDFGNSGYRASKQVSQENNNKPWTDIEHNKYETLKQEILETQRNESVMQISNMRKQVIEFAAAMEMKLKENDYKGGWDNCDKEFLTVKLMEEIHELLKAVMIGESDNYVLSEAADVANIVMMIADNYTNGRFKS